MVEKKKVGDLLALGLLLISFWIFTSITGVMASLGIWVGIIGSAVTIVAEGYFLIKSWFGQNG